MSYADYIRDSLDIYIGQREITTEFTVPYGDDTFVYVDMDGSLLYLITVREARVVLSEGPEGES